MAIFTMEIVGFGDLQITPVFAPEVEFRRAANGQVHAQIDTWSVSGALTSGDPDVLKTRRNNILSAMRGQFNHIKFKKDSGTFEEISPQTHIHGAQFRSFNIEDTGRGGEWVASLHYSFEVVGEKTVDIPGIVEADQSTEIVEEDGKTSTTISVTARGPGALPFVLGQKPSGTIRSSITIGLQADTVSGRFEVSSSSSVSLTVEETVEIAIGIFPMEMVSPSRSDKPFPIYSSREATRLSIRGTITHKPDQSVVVPVPKNLADFFSSAPTFGHGTKFTHTEVTVTTTYTLEFLISEEIDFQEFFKERSEIDLTEYLGESSNGIKVLEE